MRSDADVTLHTVYVSPGTISVKSGDMEAQVDVGPHMSDDDQHEVAAQSIRDWQGWGGFLSGMRLPDGSYMWRVKDAKNAYEYDDSEND